MNNMSAAISYEFAVAAFPEKLIYDDLARLGLSRKAQDTVLQSEYSGHNAASKKKQFSTSKKRCQNLISKDTELPIPKRVVFSDVSKMHLFQASASQIDAIQSKKQRRRFAKDAILSAMKIDLAIKSQCSSYYSEEQVMEEVIGIEQLIYGAKLARSNSTQRKEHRYAVLAEQKRQELAGSYDPVKIAAISVQYSRDACCRASYRAAYVRYLQDFM